MHSLHFEKVYTCEDVPKFYEEAQQRLRKCQNVECELLSSPLFLKKHMEKYLNEKRKDIPIIYLDAHFDNPELKGKDKFVILDELTSLKDFNCIIIVHDFDNGLGHITYDGISLDMKLIGPKLKKVNQNFNFYTNILKSCDILKPNLQDMNEANVEVCEDSLDNLEFVWSSQEKSYRGILYCLPEKLTNEELNNLGLIEWN